MPESEVRQKIPTYGQLLQILNESLKPVEYPQYKALKELAEAKERWPEDKAIKRNAQRKGREIQRYSPQVVYPISKDDEDKYKTFKELRAEIEQKIEKDQKVKQDQIPKEIIQRLAALKKSTKTEDKLPEMKTEARKIATEKGLPKMMKEEKSNSLKKTIPIVQLLRTTLLGR